MKKIFPLVFSLLFIHLAAAQQQAIRISSPDSEKEIIIEENKRIRILTADGQKLSGRFQMDGNNAILIDDQRVELMEILEIKRNPLFVSIFASGFLIYAGALTAGMGVIIGIFVEPAAFLLTIPGAGLIWAGIKSPNFSKNYTLDDNWSIEVIPVPGEKGRSHAQKS